MRRGRKAKGLFEKVAGLPNKAVGFGERPQGKEEQLVVLRCSWTLPRTIQTGIAK